MTSTHHLDTHFHPQTLNGPFSAVSRQASKQASKFVQSFSAKKKGPRRERENEIRLTWWSYYDIETNIEGEVKILLLEASPIIRSTLTGSETVVKDIVSEASPIIIPPLACSRDSRQRMFGSDFVFRFPPGQFLHPNTHWKALNEI